MTFIVLHIDIHSFQWSIATHLCDMLGVCSPEKGQLTRRASCIGLTNDKPALNGGERLQKVPFPLRSTGDTH